MDSEEAFRNLISVTIFKIACLYRHYTLMPASDTVCAARGVGMTCEIKPTIAPPPSDFCDGIPVDISTDATCQRRRTEA